MRGSTSRRSTLRPKLRAKDTEAYWIPDAFSTGGNYQTPWCIDYQVMSYGMAPAASAGPFKKDGGAYVATGRLPDGVRATCRYTTSGELSLTLTGGDIVERLHDDFMVQNVTLTVGVGSDAPSGTMIPVPTSVAGIRVVPATGALAR